MPNEQIKNTIANGSDLGSKVDKVFAFQKTLSTMLNKAEAEGDTAKISDIRGLIEENRKKIAELDKFYNVKKDGSTLDSNIGGKVDLPTNGVIDFNANGFDRFGGKDKQRHGEFKKIA